MGFQRDGRATRMVNNDIHALALHIEHAALNQQQILKYIESKDMWSRFVDVDVCSGPTNETITKLLWVMRKNATDLNVPRTADGHGKVWKPEVVSRLDTMMAQSGLDIAVAANTRAHSPVTTARVNKILDALGCSDFKNDLWYDKCWERVQEWNANGMRDIETYEKTTAETVIYPPPLPPPPAPAPPPPGEVFTWAHDYSIDDPDPGGSMFTTSMATDLDSLTFVVGAPAASAKGFDTPFSGVLYIYDEPIDEELDREGCRTTEGEGCWPFSIVIGAPKAGTTTLYYTLQNKTLLKDLTTCESAPGEGRFAADGLLGSLYGLHVVEDSMMGQGASTGSYLSKEVHMFDRPIKTELMRDPGQYTRLFQQDECPSAKFIDWTPNYFIDWAAPERMVGLVPAAWVPNMRFVSMVREPIARDLSWFNHLKREDNWPFCAATPDGNGPGQSPSYAAEAACNLDLLNKCLDFESGVEGLVEKFAACKRHPRLLHFKLNSLAAGLYVAHVERWAQFVKHSQLIVLNLESFMKNKAEHWTALFNFMGLPGKLGPEATTENDAQNEACLSVRGNTPEVEYPVGDISCDARNELAAFFKPWNELLYETLDARQKSGVAPVGEPKFEPFEELPPCSEEEKPRDCSIWLESIEQNGVDDESAPLQAK